MIELFANNASTILASSVSNVATVITLNPGSGALFPNPLAGQYFILSFTSATIPGLTEITWCTARTGDVCTIIRAQEGTTAQSWNAGDNVANFDTAGTAANFVQKQQMQQNLYNYAADTGTANNYIVTLNPTSLSNPVQGALVYMRASNSNTGTSTLTVNGGTSYTIYGQGGSPLDGGEIVSGGYYCFTFSSALSGYVLISSAGGALQIAPALHPRQAVQLNQSQCVMTSTGYFRIPGVYAGQPIDITYQWGQLTTNGSGVASGALPFTFAHAWLSGGATIVNGSAITGIATLQSLNNTDIIIDVLHPDGSPFAGVNVWWHAIGY